MNLKIKFILFLLPIVLLLNAQSNFQSGYIIKPNNDTINGYIEIRDSKSNSRQCFFRDSLAGKSQMFGPGDIEGYRFLNGKFFISKSIKEIQSGEKVFLEFLVNGRVNMYHFSDEKDRYFVEKEGEIYELLNSDGIRKIDNVDYQKERKEYIGILNYLLQDAHIQSDIQRSELGAQSLISIAQKYHYRVCDDEQCIVYEMDVKPPKFRWGIQAGMTFNQFCFGFQTITNYGMGGLIGGSMEIQNLVLWAEKISLVMDLDIQRLTNYNLTEMHEGSGSFINYNSKEYLLHYYDFPGTVQSLHVNLNTTALKVPATLNYTFGNSLFRPYIGFGVVNMFVISKNKDFIYQPFDLQNMASIPNYYFGTVGRYGCRLGLKNGDLLYLEVVNEFTQSDMLSAYDLTCKLISFTLGYTFH